MKRSLLIAVMLLISLAIQAQRNVKEQAYLHVNSTDLIVGETLCFSGYVTSMATGKLSELSSILYVELLNDEQEPVHRTKLILENGRGSGKYFIPSLTSTGVYYLVAYTRWMRNWGDYFITPITVVNPYEEIDFTQYPVYSELSIDFYPQGGQLVAEQQNEMMIQARNGVQGKAVNGRVVSNGEEVVKVKTDANGLARVSFMPEVERQYQLIIDQSGEFQFYDLPQACQKCSSLSYQRNAGRHAFQFITNDDLEDPAGLMIRSPQSFQLQRSFATSSNLDISDELLPNGLLRAELLLDGQMVASLLFWNGPTGSVEQAGSNPAFTLREEVGLTYELPSNAHFSAVVRKKSDGTLAPIDIVSYPARQQEPVFPTNNPDASTYDWLPFSSTWKQGDELGDEVRLLPEYRSDLLEGLVTDMDDQPQADLSVGLSIPSKPAQLNISQSREDGTFVLNVESDRTFDLGVLQVYENEAQRTSLSTDETTLEISDWLPPNSQYETIDVNDRFRVHLLDEFYHDYPRTFPAASLQFDSARVARLIRKSVRNQIENAYHQPPIAESKGGRSQISGFTRYGLDDFTRFPTMRDTFIEIIPVVGVSKNEDNFSIKMRTAANVDGKVYGETILMIDEVLVTSREMLTISPYLVSHIDVLNKKYFFGDKMFDGIISVFTFDGDWWNQSTRDRQVALLAGERKSEQWLQVGSRPGREPDYREQLLWVPEAFSGADGDYLLEFQTSDLPGLYEVIIEGVSDDGIPFRIDQQFEVNPNSN